MSENVLHTDSEGYRVVRRSDGKVIYERYPDKEYEYLTAEQAAERILRGEALERCYIEALSVQGLQRSYIRLMQSHEQREKVEEALEVGKKPKLNRPIICIDCLIGTIDLTNLTVEDAVNFGNLLTSAKGQQTHIWGMASFCDATFIGRTSFVGATFEDDAFFLSTRFVGHADFAETLFRAGAKFWGAKFNGASFGRAIFKNHTSFLGATFGGRVSFHDSCLLSADFTSAKFEKTCYMTNLAAGELNFKGANFSENMLISSWEGKQLGEKQSRIRKILHARKQEVKKEMEKWKHGPKEKLELLSQEKETVESLLKLLSRWKDSGRGIGAVNFEDTLVQGELRCDFKYLVPRKRGFRKWEPVILPHRIAEGFEGPPKGEEKESSYWWEEAQKQYAWLKEQYRKQGRYEDEDKAHWWASECARRTHGAIDPRRYLKFLFYKWIAGYGVNPWNIVKTICVVFVIFALLFGTVFYGKLCYEGKPLPADDGFWTRAGNALYFSGITYATIGYGDISPVGIARLLAVVEGLLGIILNAALIVVIFRKIIR